MSQTKTKKDALEDRLGAVLGRSWVVLGERLGNILVFLVGLLVFLNIGMFAKSKVSRGDLGRSWDDLGGQEAPK